MMNSFHGGSFCNHLIAGSDYSGLDVLIVKLMPRDESKVSASAPIDTLLMLPVVLL